MVRKSITISKLDAAKRQLETAITLYFHDGDPVSIHTLVSAAYNVIRAINKKRGGPPMFEKDEFIDHVKPEYQERVRRKLNQAENFFKHAERDHAATLEFNPDQSELRIFDAVRQYWKLTGEFPPLFGLFLNWYIVNHQEFFEMPEEQKVSFAKSAPTALSLGKSGFFKLVLPQLMRRGT
jgi:hypothetical protein